MSGKSATPRKLGSPMKFKGPDTKVDTMQNVKVSKPSVFGSKKNPFKGPDLAGGGHVK